MAEMIEVFEDGAENVKKIVKKNPFILAVVGVGAVALFVWWRKSQTVADTNTYAAVGYGGYPTVTGEGSSGNAAENDLSFYEEIMRENQIQTDSLLQSLTEGYDAQLQSLTEDYDAKLLETQTLLQTLTDEHNAQLEEIEATVGVLETRATTAEEKNSALEKELSKQSDISQMRANSELYGAITDKATKDALHAENLAIAQKYGWTYDPATGNYYDGNSVVYLTTKQAAVAINYANRPAAGQASNKYTNNAEYNKQVTESVLKSTASSDLGYDPTVDYSLAIVQAKESGASAETIQALQTARENKINSVYGGTDPASKEIQNKIK